MVPIRAKYKFFPKNRAFRDNAPQLRGNVIWTLRNGEAKKPMERCALRRAMRDLAGLLAGRWSITGVPRRRT